MIGATITAEVSQSDNESGVDITKCIWIYNQTSTKLGEDETNYTGKFTSANETISLTATSSGDYYLHVLTVDRAGNKKETVSEAITVKDIELTGISLNKTETTISVGKTETLSVIYTPSNATNKDIKWTTSDKTIATVDESTGLITGVKAGTVTITAISVKYPSVKAECTVTVEEIIGISTIKELEDFRDSVNNGNDYAGKKVKLMNDLDLKQGKYTISEDGTTVYDDTLEPKNWEPIGISLYGNDKPFNGTFDGQGHQIKGLYINDESKISKYQGFFGYTQNKRAIIKNVNLKDVDIKGKDTTGGLVGYMALGLIEGCSVTGTVQGCEGSYLGHIGGIAGFSGNVTIRNCFNGASVKTWKNGTLIIMGGITSQINSGTIENCYNCGKIGNGLRKWWWNCWKLFKI